MTSRTSLPRLLTLALTGEKDVTLALEKGSTQQTDEPRSDPPSGISSLK